jgi:TonB-dependent receptor
MKRPTPPLILFSFALWLTAAPIGLAQTSSSSSTAQTGGTITGRVQNVVTGNYLNKARITIKGTNLVVYTDEFGVYRIVDVPAGANTLEVFYTDLDVQEVAVMVGPRGTVERNFDLTSKARYGEASGVVKLDSFRVTSDKETDGKAIAINEQRFAPNIKNVMATDSFGDVLGSNVGEFLKFMPGLTAEYSEVEIVGISVRGIGGDKTSFTSDGAPIVSANASPSRAFNMNTLALNNISRIEVTKVPTPSTPADSLAGSVNMVSKSAFERSRAQFNYGVNLMANSENVTFKKTPHSNGDHDTRKISPGFDFDYSMPVSKNFGFVVTGFQSDKYNEQHLATTLFNAAGTGTGASISRPYLQQFTLQDGPRSQRRTTFSAKADWRVTPNSVLSLGIQSNRYTTYIGTQSWAFNAGTVATSTVAGGTPFSYSENFTRGATGRGAVTLNGSAQTFKGNTDTANLNYRFDNGTWKVEAGINRTASERSRPNPGHFSGLSSTISPARVSLLDLAIDRPGVIEVFDNAGLPVDYYNPANYRLATASEAPYNSRSGFKSANLNVRRRFNVLPFPTSLQVGGYQSIMDVDSRQESYSWTYNGPDGVAATPDSPVPFLMQSYRNQDSHYGFKNVPWTSVNRAYTAWKENPNLFTQTPAQVVAQETYRITNSEYIEETVSALYIQGEARLFKNRLSVLTGARFEKTDDEGQGARVDPAAVWARNPDGTFARNATGARIRRPEAGTAGSMEELRLTRTERGYEASRSYDGTYPSLHFTFNARENLLVRAAYAKTYGRPNLLDIIPNATFSENDLNEDDLNNPAIVRGNITIRNTALRPWTADNYDLSVEYYSQQGGVLSGGVFLKEIDDFFGNDVRIGTPEVLEELGLDARYLGWNLVTKFNSGAARITGAEVNLRHSLRELGKWGSFFTIFGNGTKLKLEGDRQADFTSFIPQSGSWGVSFNRKRVSFTAKWNYRGRDKRTALPAFGPDAFVYFASRTTLDLSAGYQFSRRLSLVASVGNVLNVPQTLQRFGSSTPEYAIQNRTSEFGVPFAIGLKGSF